MYVFACPYHCLAPGLRIVEELVLARGERMVALEEWREASPVLETYARICYNRPERFIITDQEQKRPKH